MKRFRDLTVSGSPAALRELVSELSDRLHANWTRDRDAEERLAEFGGKDAEGFVFARLADVNIPAIDLFLMIDGTRAQVPNIVPQESGDISIAQYNAVLVEFADLVRPLLARWPALKMEVSNEDVGITQWVSPEAAELLRRFSVLANMSTGSSHPSDFGRWAAFIIRVHKDGSRLYPDQLQQWLVEALKWPPEKALKLALEYEFARELLDAYDKDSD